jgi:predicted nucleic acid-binding protein
MMYLLDTTVWLERLLAQEQTETVGQLLDTIPTDQLLMTDFTLHSIGVILSRLGEGAVFPRFVRDVLIDGAVILTSLAPAAMEQVIAVIDHYHLDFDDAYQYVVAKRENAVLVSFDKDFDRIKGGRQTPAQVLVAVRSA